MLLYSKYSSAVFQYSLRMHAKKCIENYKNVSKNLQRLSRSTAAINVHPLATEALKECVLSRLNEDEVGSLIRQDEVIIVYGNRLCRKYRRHHYQNYQMIRSRLRTIARFLISIKKINNHITCLREAFTLDNIENINKAVESVANINEIGNKFESSATAYALTNQIKYITNLLAAEYTKKNDSINANITFSLYKLLEIEFAEGINATVKESQHETKRQKRIVLPETQQIAMFLKYLKTRIIHYYNLLKKSFSAENWRYLASYALVSIQVFNRKRTGEVQNMNIEDFQSYKYVDKNIDVALFESLSEQEKILVGKYVQVSIRSKRGLRAEGTPILLNGLHFNVLQDIISWRLEAGVLKENIYVFGAPGKDNYITLNACELIRKFSKESKIPNNHLLRGNQLRKHLATSITVKGYDGVTKDRVSDFMAHSKIVHKNFYELPHEVMNITKISSLLEEAAGKTIDNTDEQSSSQSSEIHNFRGANPLTLALTESKSLVLSVEKYKGITEDTRKEVSPEENLEENLSDDKSIDGSIASRNIVQRKSWTTPERRAVRDKFKNAILSGKLPSLSACRMLIEDTDVLKKRTAQQLKSWIRHQHMLLSYKTQKKQSWSTPEKHLVRKKFFNHFKRHSKPTLTECEELKGANVEILGNRTSTMIKAFFVNDSIRKRLYENLSPED